MPQPSSGAIFFGLLTQRQKEEVLHDSVAPQAAAKFKKYYETILESVGLPQLSASDRLTAFRQRAPEIWAHLQTNFPLQYEKQIVDWRRLETATLRAPTFQHAQEGAIEQGTNVPSVGSSGGPSSGGGGLSA